MSDRDALFAEVILLSSAAAVTMISDPEAMERSARIRDELTRLWAIEDAARVLVEYESPLPDTYTSRLFDTLRSALGGGQSE